MNVTCKVRALAGLCGLSGLLLLLGGGCAGAQSPAPSSAEPESPTAGRAEIERLGQAIASYRQALRLPVQAAGDAAASGAGRDEALAAPGESEAERDDRSLSPGETMPPAPQPLAPPVAQAAPAPGEEADGCPQPCRLTRAICAAAARICRIAGYLGEPDAWQRCRRANADCAAAQRVTEGRCAECSE